MRKLPPMTVAHMLVPLSALSLSLSLCGISAAGSLWLWVILGAPPPHPPAHCCSVALWPSWSQALTLVDPELVLALSRSR